ncbi:TrkA C-terminal domain-containing protein [bacterium]|nr:TrkA C-terminal domain-containing protein [bacterium]MBU4560782.1 TrkA C-terminal domain-containing protein [bacterium]MCG2675573.1 TrkA C-terminal domain-containing protein [bacterium]MCG2677877.1 TrkA C-terminal domain-containing protein [bacterium]
MATILLILPVIVIIVFSTIIVRIATIALKMTGLDEKRARFQALSAFTGTGFTTKDSELIVGHEQRRRIIMTLMILGNAGLITVVATLILSFTKGGLSPAPIKLILLGLAIYLIYRLASHKGLTRKFTKGIEKRLARSAVFTKKPIEETLRLAKGYGVAEISLKEGSPHIGLTLQETDFKKRGIMILAIERGKDVIHTPKGGDKLCVDDTLICYGKLPEIKRVARIMTKPEG